MRISDWSSDVCSSDLPAADEAGIQEHEERIALVPRAHRGEARDLHRVAFGAEDREQIRLPAREFEGDHRRAIAVGDPCAGRREGRGDTDPEPQGRAAEGKGAVPGTPRPRGAQALAVKPVLTPRPP